MQVKKINVYCDGGSRGNPGPAAIAFAVKNSKGKTISKNKRFIGVATNNVAEYKAVIFAFKWLLKNNFKGEVIFLLDSELVVKQLNGEYKIKDSKLKPLALVIKKQIDALAASKVSFTHIPRLKNKTADSLVNESLDANT